MKLRFGFALFALIYFVCLGMPVLGQKLVGYVLDYETQGPVEMVNVIVKRTQEGCLTDINGKFEISVQLFDTVLFSSMNYEQNTIVVTTLGNKYYYLKAKTHNLNEVKVEADKAIPNMYKSNVFPENDPRVLSAVVHPTAFLYYKLNKKERSKQKIREDMAYQKRMEKVFTIYTKDLVAEFTGFTDQELEECFIYCTANIELEENDDEFSIKFKLLEILSKYYESKK